MIRLLDRNRRVRVAGVVVLVALGIFAFLEARPALQEPDALAIVDLSIIHPESVDVGERIPITVQGLAGRPSTCSWDLARSRSAPTILR